MKIRSEFLSESMVKLLNYRIEQEELLHANKAAYAEENIIVAELGLWYCKEQVEELDKFQTLFDKLKIYGEEADLLGEMEEMASV